VGRRHAIPVAIEQYPGEQARLASSGCSSSCSLVATLSAERSPPPIGINLFVIQSIWNGKLSEVVLGTIPFHLLMLVLLIMLMIWRPHNLTPAFLRLSRPAGG
jgi:hypothetical protein